MSISNIGTGNVQQNRGVNAPETVGDLGGHTVTQAPVPQQPAGGTGIGARIASFFTSTLPKFFRSLGESISGLFGRAQQAPQAGQTGTETTPTTGARETAPIGQAQQQPGSLQTVYDTILGATQNFDRGTFLRLNNPSSPIIRSTLDTVGTRYTENVLLGLPKTGVLAVRVAPFEGQNTGYTQSQLRDRQQVIETSMKCLQETWGRLFGDDEISTGMRARALPQPVKDLLATAFKAIDDSQISTDDKRLARQRVISDVVLRGINPHLDKESVTNESVRELNAMMMSITSGLPPERLNQRGAYVDEVVTHLTTRVEGTGLTRLEIMQHNMYQTFLKAGEMGTPFGQDAS